MRRTQGMWQKKGLNAERSYVSPNLNNLATQMWFISCHKWNHSHPRTKLQPTLVRELTNKGKKKKKKAETPSSQISQDFHDRYGEQFLTIFQTWIFKPWNGYLNIYEYMHFCVQIYLFTYTWKRIFIHKFLSIRNFHTNKNYTVWFIFTIPDENVHFLPLKEYRSSRCSVG